MSESPQAFAEAFEQKFAQHKGKPRLEFLVHFRPREFHFYILVLVELKVKYRKKFHFQSMFEHFPLQHWEEAVLQLLKGFAKNRPKRPQRIGLENGVSIVEAAMAAAPEYFADILDQIFLADLKFPGNVGGFMWRKYGTAYAEFIRFHIEVNENDQEEQSRALSVAFQMGTEEMLRFAKDIVRHEMQMPRKLIEGLNLTNEMLNAHLIEQGLAWQGNDLVQLYQEEVWHFIFPQAYLMEDCSHESFQNTRRISKGHVFGGAMKASNHKGQTVQIQHLLSLDPIPKHLRIQGLHRLIFACDLSHVLLNPGISYQKHHPNGSITLLDDDRISSATAGTMPFIRSAKIDFAIQGPQWYFQRYIKGHNHYRLGGPPVFNSGTFYPECKSCKRTMRFLMELDSSLPLANDKPLEWGVEGMAYFYWCDKCQVSAVHWFSD